MKKFIVNFSLLITICFLSAVSVSAAKGISISPVNYYLKVAAGVPQILPYTLTNETTQDLRVSLVVKSFFPDEKGIPQLQTETDFPFLSLVEATMSGELILPAGTTKKMAVLIDTPLGIAEKEYPLAVLFVLQPKNVDTLTSQVKINLGSNLVILVGENNLDLSRLHIVEPQLPKVIDSWSLIKLRLQGKNLGQMGTLMTGKVVLRRKDGTIIKEEKIYPDLVLAQATREFRYKLMPDIQGKTVITSDWSWPGFLLGEYVLQVQLGKQNWQTVLWFFPYWLLAALLGATGLVIGLKVLYNKNHPKAPRQLQEKINLMKKQEKFFQKK